MYRFTRKHGCLLTGIMVAALAGCHDDNDKKVSYRRERPEPRHTNVDVDVAIGEPEPDVIVEEPPPDVVVVERSRPVVVVREAPPALIVERRPRPPAYAHIWIEGYWHHNGHKFVWKKGHFERERRGHHYVPARWTHGDHGWELREGHWE